MASKTDIANMAISHLGLGKEISNMDTEKSEEARACRRFYDVAKQAVLADLDWPLATKYATLGLVTERPDDEWAYAYRYPTNCLVIRRIKSGTRNDTRYTREPYKIIRDDAGKLIYSDKSEAVIEYTVDLNDTSVFSAEFTLALSFRLAAYISARLTKGDPFKLKNDMLVQYQSEIAKAKKNAFNEEQADIEPESQFITIRT